MAEAERNAKLVCISEAQPILPAKREIQQMLRNSVKNGYILADGVAQLALLPFSFMYVAEEMPLGLRLQNKVENLYRT